MTSALLVEHCDDFALGSRYRHSVKAARIDDDAALVLRERFVEWRRRLLTFCADDANDRQTKDFRKFEIALVVTRYGHDRASAVLHQHVVGDPDRDLLSGRRIERVRAGEDTGLFRVRLSRHEILLCTAREVLVDRASIHTARERPDHRVLRSDHYVRSAEDRIRPGREYANSVVSAVLLYRKGDFGAF